MPLARGRVEATQNLGQRRRRDVDPAERFDEQPAQRRDGVLEPAGLVAEPVSGIGGLDDGLPPRR